MCEPDHLVVPPQPSPSSSSSPATPQSQVLSASPAISTRCTPKLVRRMQGDTCFRCHKKGHWSWYCSFNSPSNTDITTNPSGFPNIHCRCGHGFCEVKTAQNDRNRGKKYYACPIKRGSKCNKVGFVKWCDDHIDQSYFHPPPYKYPECQCGAGVCQKVEETQSTGVVKCYFTCPVKKNLGSCGYRVWEDDLLVLDNKSIVPIRQSTQRTLHDFWEGCQTDETHIDLDNGDDLLLEHSKRMRMMDNSEKPSLMAVSELLEGGDAALKAVPLNRREHDETTPLSASSKPVGFPEFEVVDDLENMDIVNSVPWDDIEKKSFLLSRQSTPSRIHPRRRLFQRQIIAVADSPLVACPMGNSLGPIAVDFSMGWLGRLFFHPMQGLKFPQHQPFFCCIFPSFNAIVVPKQASIREHPCGECNQLAISNLNQHVQSPTDCHTEVSRDEVSPNSSQGSERKPMSKAERQRQMVLFAQQQLLDDLESVDPLDHESMREAAEATFGALDGLKVDYKQFSDHVWDFISSASSLAGIKKSMENLLSCEEYSQLYEKEKVRFADIQDNYVKTKALLEASNQRKQSLCEEVSRLEAMLHEKQNQLTSCELETLKMESQLSEINRNMSKAEAALKVRAEQAVVARKLIEEKTAKQNAAKTAFENAKLELEK